MQVGFGVCGEVPVCEIKELVRRVEQPECNSVPVLLAMVQLLPGLTL
jgi:hypothetical protein